MAAVRKIFKSKLCGKVSGAEGLKLMENLGRKEENDNSVELQERRATYRREVEREERRIRKLRSDCFLPAKVHVCLIRKERNKLLILIRKSWR